jgi:hypothetical protein
MQGASELSYICLIRSFLFAEVVLFEVGLQLRHYVVIAWILGMNMSDPMHETQEFTLIQQFYECDYLSVVHCVSYCASQRLATICGPREILRFINTQLNQKSKESSDAFPLTAAITPGARDNDRCEKTKRHSELAFWGLKVEGGDTSR